MLDVTPTFLAESDVKVQEALALGEDPDGKSKMDTDWLRGCRTGLPACPPEAKH